MNKPWSEKFANEVLQRIRDEGFEITPGCEDEVIAGFWEEQGREVQQALAAMVEADGLDVVGFVEGEDGKPEPLYAPKAVRS